MKVKLLTPSGKTLQGKVSMLERRAVKLLENNPQDWTEQNIKDSLISLVKMSFMDVSN